MSPDLVEIVVSLRLSVGLLGEQGQTPWWPSAFFAPFSRAFLAPVFPKTSALAQCRGVTHAAARIHDDAIGVGSVLHLFRLPEDFEQSIHRLLQQPEHAGRMLSTVKDAESARSAIKKVAQKKQLLGTGPVRVGRVTELSNHDLWRVVAAHYDAGFNASSRVFPFFAAT